MTTPRGRARNQVNIAMPGRRHRNQRDDELRVMHRTRASVDRSPEGQDTAGGLIEDESAVPEGQTP